LLSQHKADEISTEKKMSKVSSKENVYFIAGYMVEPLGMRIAVALQ
jgi:hypothetical protein